MTIKIPQSLYDDLLGDVRKYVNLRFDAERQEHHRLVFMGPYGEFYLQAVPDEEFTETRTEEVKRYKG